MEQELGREQYLEQLRGSVPDLARQIIAIVQFSVYLFVQITNMVLKCVFVSDLVESDVFRAENITDNNS